MIRKALWILLPVGYVTMVWYGVTGETGPMGWLNALQQHRTGHHSRKLSFLMPHARTCAQVIACGGDACGRGEAHVALADRCARLGHFGCPGLDRHLRLPRLRRADPHA